MPAPSAEFHAVTISASKRCEAAAWRCEEESPKNVEPGGATGGGGVGASGLMFWIARAGGQKVTIRSAERGSSAGVPSIPEKNALCEKKFETRGTTLLLPRCAVRIVTFCPPALAIHEMSPDAPTSPPPGGASGLNIFGAPHESLYNPAFARVLSDAPA